MCLAQALPAEVIHGLESRKLFVSPHNDDETLFGAFTIMREKPNVVIVYDSFIQPARGHFECDWKTRREETRRAVNILSDGQSQVIFLGFSDAEEVKRESMIAALAALRDSESYSEVWCPAWHQDGHAQHNAVALACGDVFSNGAHTYPTYSRRTGSRVIGIPVAMTGAMVRKKLMALACYKTQLENDALGCWPHFVADQTEYVSR